jgi:hypothetical protein
LLGHPPGLRRRLHPPEHDRRIRGGDILAGDAADVDASCSAWNIPKEEEEEGGDGAVANNHTTT